MAHVETQTVERVATSRDVKLIDCDVHAQPTEAMLAEHLGPTSRRLLERYGRRTPRITEWYPRARNAGMRVDAWPGKPGHIWGSDPQMLCAQVLDEYGVDYALLEVLSGQDGYDDADFASEWNSAVNEWRLQSCLEFDSRLRATIAVPHEYPDLAVAEIERRAGDGRFLAVLMPSSAIEPLGRASTGRSTRRRPPTAGRSCSHRRLQRPPRSRLPSFYLEYHVANGIGMQAQLTSMVAGGMFEAIPGVRVVLTECGVAWAAALRWSLDAAWQLMRDDHPRLQRRPSEYIDEHVWFTTQPIEEPANAQHLLYAIDHARLAERLLFATDYPHWDFDSPAQALPGAMKPELRRRMLFENALDLYGLPRQRETVEA